jgi:NADH dehydrogenase
MTSLGAVDVVTGAFSYSGAAIARELQSAGGRVRTLTGHSDRAPVGSQVEVRPLNFDDPVELIRSLQGVHTFYNTYWVRFAHGHVDHEAAVANSRTLFEAAARAGVERIVHVSITHPSLDSPYPYFRGKAQVEQILRELGVSHAIARPAILFGGDGVLINNIAWLLRHLPVFAIGGRGAYRVRPIHVDDLARLCVELGTRTDTITLDAVGPQALPFRQLVDTLRAAVGSHALVVPVPAAVLITLSRAVGLALHDTLLSRDEYHAMADGLADSDAPTTGTVVLTEWIAEHAGDLGRRYANEFDRHFRHAATTRHDSTIGQPETNRRSQ